METLLDTDILSALMRRESVAIARAQSYLATHDQFTFSAITRYEILRGLKAKNAVAQLKAFEQFCAVNSILPITDEIILHAADIYARLYQSGQLIGDADILIAATAKQHKLTLVTNNINHFSRIDGLDLENWLE
jgi:tRNA(fMet)-specific endonuclease VapC